MKHTTNDPYTVIWSRHQYVRWRRLELPSINCTPPADIYGVIINAKRAIQNRTSKYANNILMSLEMAERLFVSNTDRTFRINFIDEEEVQKFGYQKLVLGMRVRIMDHLYGEVVVCHLSEEEEETLQVTLTPANAVVLTNFLCRLAGDSE